MKNELSITKRGKEWEKKRSRFLVLPFFFLGGPALMYAGSRVRKKNWFVEGLVYFLMFFVGMAIGNTVEPFAYLNLAAYIIPIIRCLSIRDEYLIRLDRKLDLLAASNAHVIDGGFATNPRIPGNSPLVNKREVKTPVKSVAVTQPVKLFEHIKMMSLDDYFKPMEARYGNNVYFYRICGYNQEVDAFLNRYIHIAADKGVVITDSLKPVKDIEQSSYYDRLDHTMALNIDFFRKDLREFNSASHKIPDDNINILADSIYSTMTIVRHRATDWNEIKKFYAMVIYWIDNKFSGIIPYLGTKEPPKILIDGQVEYVSLMMLNIISDAGSDVVMIQQDRGIGYKDIDPDSEISHEAVIAGLDSFPSDYTVNMLHAKTYSNVSRYIQGRYRNYEAATNVSATGDIYADVKRDPDSRRIKPGFYYNIYARVIGCPSKTGYKTELYGLYSTLKAAGRGVVAVDYTIPKPDMAELASLADITYTDFDDTIEKLAAKIQYGFDIEFQWLLINRYVEYTKRMAASCTDTEVFMRDAKMLIILLRRYMLDLFLDQGINKMGCFMHLGTCKEEHEVLFMNFLATLPVDVLIIIPDAEAVGVIEDERLIEQHFPYSENIDKFPIDQASLGYETVAYRAEQELTEVLYTGTGLYREHQYEHAMTIPFKTMYEEIAIFWNEDVTHRPAFVINNNFVTVPVIFTKLTGVKDKNIDGFWDYIYYRKTDSTVIINNPPYMKPENHVVMDSLARGFVNRGELNRDAIILNPAFGYGSYRKSLVDHMLDKLQLLLDGRIIKSQSGDYLEETIVATVLSLDNRIVRMIQDFDFVGKSPKVLYIHTNSDPVSIEDAIVLAYLHLIGFDILIFSPTGDQSVERFYNKDIVNEMIVGPYVYDLKPVQISKYVPKSANIFNKIFK